MATDPGKLTVTTEFVYKLPNPFLRLFHSRKFWIALMALAGVVLAEYTPLSTELQIAIVALGWAVIDGITKEDVAEKQGGGSIFPRPTDLTIEDAEHVTLSEKTIIN